MEAPGRRDPARQLLHRPQGPTSAAGSATPNFELVSFTRRLMPIRWEVDRICIGPVGLAGLHYSTIRSKTAKTSFSATYQHAGLAPVGCGPACLNGQHQLSVLASGVCHPSRRSYRAASIPTASAPATTRVKRVAETLAFDYTTSGCTARRSASPGSSTPTGHACCADERRVVSNFIVQALRGETS